MDRPVADEPALEGDRTSLPAERLMKIGTTSTLRSLWLDRPGAGLAARIQAQR